MAGAIVGDIVGSVYEFDNHKSKGFPLFREDSKFTDNYIEDTMAFAFAPRAR
jgi:hypothetical protein